MSTYPSEIAAMLADDEQRAAPPLPLVWQCYPTTFLMFEGDRPPAHDIIDDTTWD